MSLRCQIKVELRDIIIEYFRSVLPDGALPFADVQELRGV